MSGLGMPLVNEHVAILLPVSLEEAVPETWRRTKGRSNRQANPWLLKAHPGQAVMWSPASPSRPFSGKFQDVFSSVENKVDDVSWLPWHSTAGSGWVSGRLGDPLREGPHMADWGTVTRRMEGTAHVNTTKQHSKARSVQGRPTLPKCKEAFLCLLLTLSFAAGLIENREMEKNNSIKGGFWWSMFVEIRVFSMLKLIRISLKPCFSYAFSPRLFWQVSPKSIWQIPVLDFGSSPFLPVRWKPSHLTSDPLGETAKPH